MDETLEELMKAQRARYFTGNDGVLEFVYPPSEYTTTLVKLESEMKIETENEELANIATVRFVESSSIGAMAKTYDYFVRTGDNVEVGDYVLTSTYWKTDKNGDRSALSAIENNAGIAIVTDVGLKKRSLANKYYVLLIKAETLKKHWADDYEEHVKKKQREQAILKLEEMLAKQDKMARYRELANNNEEAKKLLELLEGK